MNLLLFVAPDGVATVLVCGIKQVIAENLEPGTNVYNLGLANPELPPGRALFTVRNIAPILLANTSPVIEGPSETPAC